MFIEIVSGSANSTNGSVFNAIGSLTPTIGNGLQNVAPGAVYRDDRDGTMFIKTSGSANAWVQLGFLPTFGTAIPTTPPVGMLTGSIYLQI